MGEPTTLATMDVECLLPVVLAEELIWKLLDRRPGRRPSVDELARTLGTDARHLRVRLRADRCAPAREMITYGCLTYAARLIAEGVKIEAAMLIAGFHNKTNFCRQFREFLGCQPGRYRPSARPRTART